jgi:ribonucleotide monophosphatase NagD (HAD superfamily)
MRRIVADVGGNPALLQQPEGVTVFVVGAAEHVEVQMTDEQWADLQTQIQTQEVDFVTVKEDFGVTEELTE